MGKTYAIEDDGYRLSDALWAQMEPLLPSRPSPPLAATSRLPLRKVMDAIFFVLRTDCQWNALNATGLCSSSVAHRRFQEWTQAGVFEAFWQQGLLAYDGLEGIDWTWLSLDGAMGKAPRGGEENRPQPHRPGQARDQAQPARGRARHAALRRRGRRQPQRSQTDGRDLGGDPGRTAQAQP